MKISKMKVLFSSVILVVLIAIIVIGATYAFFQAEDSNDNIVGSTYSTDFGIKATEIKKSTSLMPVNDEDIVKAVSKSDDKCVDNSGNELCSLYKIDVENHDLSTSLHGFIRTSNSTYTTSNLKYQVYDSNFVAVTDVMTITHNSGDTVYFKKNNQNYITIMADGTEGVPATISYYIVFWISEIGGPQNEDQEKTYDCKIGFESMHGDKLTSTFVVSA